MRISQLIAELTTLQSMLGDVPVEVRNVAGDRDLLTAIGLRTTPLLHHVICLETHEDYNENPMAR